jgi:hypothetical protein
MKNYYYYYYYLVTHIRSLLSAGESVRFTRSGFTVIMVFRLYVLNRNERNAYLNQL